MCNSGPPDGAFAGVWERDGCHDLRRVTLLPADGECPGRTFRGCDSHRCAPRRRVCSPRFSKAPHEVGGCRSDQVGRLPPAAPFQSCVFLPTDTIWLDFHGAINTRCRIFMLFFARAQLEFGIDRKKNVPKIGSLTRLHVKRPACTEHIRLTLCACSLWAVTGTRATSSFQSLSK